MELTEVKVIDVSPGELRGYISSFVIVDEKVAVVDPGPESAYDKLRSGLEALGVKPDLIVVTHVHLDHAGSAAHLLKDFPSAIVFSHPRGVPHIVDPSKLYDASFKVAPILPRTYGKPLAASPERVFPAEDGKVLELGSSRVRVIYTPGHASHHMSLLLEPDGIIFTGDSAGVIFTVKGHEVMLPTTPPPFKPMMYVESIDKMASLKPRSIAPTHFGIHGDAMAWLERAKSQVTLWLKLIKGSSDHSYGVLEDLLAKNDDHVRSLLSDGEEFMIKGFLENTIDGLVDAVKRGEPLPA
ncbi:MBL fold metallo-hydrolase [Acidilobus saccharovorans]|uniref:MBL fold metallo-hydrolase n=1 Tax=Acidilobus saccharovorans TaxID=242703 RepID=UPI0006629B0F|nr:MBL fold metallo-hydrolase [Acidilobus saccharovorans]